MKKVVFLFWFLILHLCASGQSNLFEKYLFGFGSFEVTDVLEYDSHYYLLCNKSFATFDQQSSFLIKINKLGDSVTTYKIDISYHFVLRAFSTNKTGGLCFVGGIDSLQSNFSFSRDGLFIQSDYEGKITNSKSYRMPVKNELNNILESDSFYFASGNRFPSVNNVDMQAVKIGTNGHLLDSVFFDFRNTDAVTSIRSAEENILLSGTILGGFNDGYLLLCNKNLDSVFFKKFYAFKDSNMRDVSLWYSYTSKFANNGTILFPCVFFTRNPVDTNDWSTFEHSGLIRTDKNGNLKSLHIYYLNSRYDRPIEIFETRDGNYIIAGTINFATRRPIPEGINGDFYLMKVDTLGNILWFKQYGNNNYQELKSVIETTDGGFLLSGYSIVNYPLQERVGYVVKTDTDGNISLGINNFSKIETTVFPNPASTLLFFSSSIPFNNYSIYNLLGQRISVGVAENNNIEISLLSQGIYILELSNTWQKVQVKFIKE